MSEHATFVEIADTFRIRSIINRTLCFTVTMFVWFHSQPWSTWYKWSPLFQLFFNFNNLSFKLQDGGRHPSHLKTTFLYTSFNIFFRKCGRSSFYISTDFVFYAFLKFSDVLLFSCNRYYFFYFFFKVTKLL